MDRSQTKKQIRQHFLKKRNIFYKQCEPKKASGQASGHITSFLMDRVGTWASYRPVHSEFHPRSIEQDHPRLTWVYPKVKGDSLEFRRPLNRLSVWKKNIWGIEELTDESSEVVAIDDLKGVFCPAVAVDRKGHRIGYGKGYYDRTLTSFKGEKIGLVFWIQISLNPIPQDKEDMAMDWILTEKEFLVCKDLT